MIFLFLQLNAKQNLILYLKITNKVLIIMIGSSSWKLKNIFLNYEIEYENSTTIFKIKSMLT